MRLVNLVVGTDDVTQVTLRCEEVVFEDLLNAPASRQQGLSAPFLSDEAADPLLLLHPSGFSFFFEFFCLFFCPAAMKWKDDGSDCSCEALQEFTGGTGEAVHCLLHTRTHTHAQPVEVHPGVRQLCIRS